MAVIILSLLKSYTEHVLMISVCLCPSPPVRHQWGQRDRPAVHTSLHQDENFHHPVFSQHQQIPLDESRQYSHTSAPPRMLHTATQPPQQSSIMVDLHEQVLMVSSLSFRPEVSNTHFHLGVVLH